MPYLSALSSSDIARGVDAMRSRDWERHCEDEGNGVTEDVKPTCSILRKLVITLRSMRFPGRYQHMEIAPNLYAYRSGSEKYWEWKFYREVI